MECRGGHTYGLTDRVTNYCEYMSCSMQLKTVTINFTHVGPNNTTTTQMGDGGAAAMNIEAEGPILLSTTEVNRTFVFQQLRQTVEQLRGVGAIR